MWFEVAVILALTWLPFLCGAVSGLVWSIGGRGTPFEYDMVNHVFHAVQICVPVLYIIWRSGDSWAHFGIRPLRPMFDALSGVALFGIDMAAYWLFWIVTAPLYWLLDRGADSSYSGWSFDGPSGPFDYILLVAGCLSIGAYEELTMRGFLIPRLERLLGSTSKAVVASSVLFASYHIYQNPMMVVFIFLGGLLFGAAFCLIRRIWPLILGHALIDIAAYLWN